MCKLGFLCSADKIASTVPVHELRYSRGDQVVVLIDGERLRALVSNMAELDAEIERLVIEAAMS
jgi:hypothetical protein